MRITGISGSLRKESGNSKLIQVANQCCPLDVEFVITDCLDRLPHFNPDLRIDDFEALVQWVELIRDSDGLVISSPEYARGYPGTLKNALDWLVQTDAYIEKPFMLLNANARSTVAKDSLVVVLKTMSGIYHEQASVTIPLIGKSLSVEQLMDMNEVTVPVREGLNHFIDAIRYDSL